MVQGWGWARVEGESPPLMGLLNFGLKDSHYWRETWRTVPTTPRVGKVMASQNGWRCAETEASVNPVLRLWSGNTASEHFTQRQATATMLLAFGNGAGAVTRRGGHGWGPVTPVQAARPGCATTLLRTKGRPRVLLRAVQGTQCSRPRVPGKGRSLPGRAPPGARSSVPIRALPLPRLPVTRGAPLTLCSSVSPLKSV